MGFLGGSETATLAVLAVLGAGVVAGIVFGVSWLVGKVYDEIMIGRRVSRLSGDASDISPDQLFSERRESKIESVLSALLPTIAATRLQLRQAGLPISFQFYILFVLLITAAIALRFAHLLAAGFAVANLRIPEWGMPLLIAAAVHYLLSLGVLPILINRRRRKILSMLPTAVDHVARAMSVGQTLETALSTASVSVEQPLAGYFDEIARMSRLGVNLADALEHIGREIDLPEWDFLAAACVAQMASGGNLTVVLRSLSETIRSREHLLEKVKSLAAEGKLSAFVLSAIPPLLLLYINHSNPVYTEALFDTKIGNAILVGSTVWATIGIFVMLRLIRIKV